jgi:hypothetical protein
VPSYIPISPAPVPLQLPAFLRARPALGVCDLALLHTVVLSLGTVAPAEVAAVVAGWPVGQGRSVADAVGAKCGRAVARACGEEGAAGGWAPLGRVHVHGAGSESQCGGEGGV